MVLKLGGAKVLLFSIGGSKCPHCSPLGTGLEGVGEASIELAVPNAPSTVFRIGSCSKQFTALAILLLADRGVLRVSDSLGALMYDETESAPHWRPWPQFHKASSGTAAHDIAAVCDPVQQIAG